MEISTEEKSLLKIKSNDCGEDIVVLDCSQKAGSD